MECFLLNLSSQCHYCNDLLKKGIIDNSNSFQNSVDSFDDLDLEGNDGEDNIIETSDGESISLDSNIDLILNNIIIYKLIIFFNVNQNFYLVMTIILHKIKLANHRENALC